MRIYTAASLVDVVEAMAVAYDPSGNTVVVPAASSTLARQIARGAPADLFLSADQRWIDWLSEQGKIIPDSIVAMAGNTLVVIVPNSNEKSRQMPNATDPVSVADTLLPAVAGRIALADPDHVPLGRYARAVLKNDGLWADIEPGVVPAANARAALRLVEGRAVAAGIVYRTDAIAGDVMIIGALAQPEPPIVYWAARVGEPQSGGGPDGNADAADGFLNFLQSAQAMALLCRSGFLLVGQDGQSGEACEAMQ
ncbi:MAG: molybdate ABC transporter substrate-binding protein [Alphaproteobacteria bacterium]